MKETETNGSNNFFIVALKIGITTSLLVFIFQDFDTRQFTNTIRNVNYFYIISAFLIHIAAFCIFAVRWWILLRLTTDCPFNSIIPAYYLGLFWNNLLPTSIGGDVVRILYLRQKGFRTNELIHSSLADRIIGLFSIVLLGATAMTTNTYMNENNTFSLLLLLAVLGASVFIVSKRCMQYIRDKVQPYTQYRLARTLVLIVETTTLYIVDKKKLLHVLFYSFTAQFLIILSYIFLSRALDVTLPYYIYFSIIPVVFLASSIPVSIGGLGVRESVLISLLAIYSVSSQTAISLSIIYFCMLILVTLPGAIFILGLRQK